MGEYRVRPQDKSAEWKGDCDLGPQLVGLVPKWVVGLHLSREEKKNNAKWQHKATNHIIVHILCRIQCALCSELFTSRGI